MCCYAWLPRKCDYQTDRCRIKRSLCAAVLRRQTKTKLEWGCPNGTKYPPPRQPIPNHAILPNRARLQTDGQTDRQTDRQTDGRTDGRTDGQTDGRTDGRTGWFQYTPPNFVAGGIKNDLWPLTHLTTSYEGSVSIVSDFEYRVFMLRALYPGGEMEVDLFSAEIRVFLLRVFQLHVCTELIPVDFAFWWPVDLHKQRVNLVLL